ncbi:hypothetical protein BKA56DRAFT_598004 [Ilyonectria sp. MPI-CAGE-AT-0026]|nr:hypothetical protein BKA56DRAFT_598004 [Ilyonectria sp. MPI-CAGE-AT-0026]
MRAFPQTQSQLHSHPNIHLQRPQRSHPRSLSSFLLLEWNAELGRHVGTDRQRPPLIPIRPLISS